MKLELYYPTKPYRVTQEWGVPNEAYLHFGFSAHNGIDFAVDIDGIVQAMSDGVIIEMGYNPTGSGNYVIYKTKNVECEGVVCDVCFYYMHAKSVLVKVGDFVKVGTDLIIADNTGFSTGPHTHITAYRLLKDSVVRLDKDPTTDHTFDHSKYFNGKYAEDYRSSTHIFNTDYHFGDYGNELVLLQQKLALLGYFKGETYPRYGELTCQAVYELQLDKVPNLSWWEKNILRGRTFGPKTRERINSL